MSTEANIHIEKGTTWKWQLQVNDETTGLPVDYSAYTGKCHIREDANSTAILAAPTIVCQADGVIKFSLTAAETSLIPTKGSNYDQYSYYFYDLMLTHTATGEVTQLLYGYAFVYPSITR